MTYCMEGNGCSKESQNFLLREIDEWNRINNQYNDARQANILADAESIFKELIEGLKLEIDDIKNEINILSDLVKDIAINARDIEAIKH